MNIGLDANPANRLERTGTERYAYELIQAMKREALHEEERVILYSSESLKDDLANLPRQWGSRVLRWPSRRFWSQGRLSWEMLRHPPDLLFVPAHAVPLIHPHNSRKGRRTATTVHDLGFKRLPKVYPDAERRYLDWSTRLAARHAELIFTPSHFTKQEFLELYRVPEDRVVVTPLAVKFTRLQNTGGNEINFERLRMARRLPAVFFLYVGRLEAKKNIENLLAGFALFKSRRGVGDPIGLVLVGKPGFGYSRLKAILNGLDSSVQVNEVGWLSDNEILILRRQAVASVVPSWYEGFGLVTLEALAAGSPLICSDIPVFHEVIGSAALFADPFDPESLAECLRVVADDSSIRQKLIETGRQHLENFSWEKTAATTLSALRSYFNFQLPTSKF